ncbi:ion channel [Halovulum sp. GXIMD14794]
MLAPLLIGSAMVVGNMAIQIAIMLFAIRRMAMMTERLGVKQTWLFQTRILGGMVLILFFGHVLQFATWAVLFMWLGEFTDFATAFYHSAVNFTSLGYGDIVMSERWRLLGPFDAANGVLMFGLSAGAILSVMQFLMNSARSGRSPDPRRSPEQE